MNRENVKCVFVKSGFKDRSKRDLLNHVVIYLGVNVVRELWLQPKYLFFIELIRTKDHLETQLTEDINGKK